MNHIPFFAICMTLLLVSCGAGVTANEPVPALDPLATFRIGTDENGLPQGDVTKLRTLPTPEPRAENGWAWYDAAAWETEGQAFSDVTRRFARYPARAENVIPSGPWYTGQHSTGMVVRFRTNANAIHVQYDLWNPRLGIAHMPATGVSGVDLYIHDGRSWRWAGNFYPENQNIGDTPLIDGMTQAERDCMLYLPLYNGIERLEIGVPEGSSFTAIAPLHSATLDDSIRQKPFLYYGTSIAQGAGANRPGMAYTALLARRLDVPAWNFGSDGSGRMEESVAHFFAELDPCVYILDCLPNMDAAQIDANTERFVRILKEAHPDTPVILVEDRPFDNAWLRPGIAAHHRNSREHLWAVYKRLTDAGITGVYYLSADNLMGRDSEGAADGSHPSDLGMVRMTHALEPVIRKALNMPPAE
ncbi:MAG: SGNH/GDSL hydrolase family protein [Planctomycetia bacterium]|nr:SGNH/GDSL hydrolase family protein [Planctomycetia bacterium]